MEVCVRGIKRSWYDKWGNREIPRKRVKNDNGNQKQNNSERNIAKVGLTFSHQVQCTNEPIKRLRLSCKALGSENNARQFRNDTS